MGKQNLKIGIVGPCSAGKSTLITNLKHENYPNSHHIAQEHSKVPDMWSRLDEPDILIYLDVSYDVSMRRRSLDMSPAEFAEQVHRLRHACAHADLFIPTDNLSPREVLDTALIYLQSRQS